jgi:CRP-like cAMP-binding protein
MAHTLRILHPIVIEFPSLSETLVSSENIDAFPTLSATELALLEDHGARRSIAVGDYLFHQGDQTNEFYVVLSGAVEIVMRAKATDRVIPGTARDDLSASSIC